MKLYNIRMQQLKSEIDIDIKTQPQVELIYDIKE